MYIDRQQRESFPYQYPSRDPLASEEEYDRFFIERSDEESLLPQSWSLSSSPRLRHVAEQDAVEKGRQRGSGASFEEDVLPFPALDRWVTEFTPRADAEKETAKTANKNSNAVGVRLGDLPLIGKIPTREHFF